MDIARLKKLNDESMKNYIDYKGNIANNCVVLDNIKNYHSAKNLFNEVKDYKELFNINACDFANKVKAELIKKMGEKSNFKNYELGISMVEEKDIDIKNEYLNTHHKDYIYALVLKDKNNPMFFTLPIAQDSFGITSNNEDDFVFDEEIALNNFKNKEINLLENKLFYIANIDNNKPCAIVEQFGLQDFLWNVVEEQINLKREEKIAKLKNQIANYNKEIKELKKENLDELIK